AFNGLAMTLKAVQRGPTDLILVRQDDDTLGYETGGFVAIVRPDCAVTFVDRSPVEEAPAPLCGAGRRPPATRGNSVIHDLFAAPHRQPDGVFPLMSGSFDLNEPILRAAGIDPYNAEKSCFLDDTADLRDALAQEHRAQQRGRALVALAAELQAIVD